MQPGHHIMAGWMFLSRRIVSRDCSRRSRRQSKASTGMAGYHAFRNVSIISANQTFWASPEAIGILSGASSPGSVLKVEVTASASDSTSFHPGGCELTCVSSLSMENPTAAPMGIMASMPGLSCSWSVYETAVKSPDPSSPIVPWPPRLDTRGVRQTSRHRRRRTGGSSRQCAPSARPH